jgi:hypothetical protein
VFEKMTNQEDPSNNAHVAIFSPEAPQNIPGALCRVVSKPG